MVSIIIPVHNQEEMTMACIESIHANTSNYEILIVDNGSDPPAQFHTAELKDIIDRNYTHYTNSMGIIEFRKAVQKYTKQYWKFRPLISQILECPANAIIDFVIRCVADIGDEIIHPEPGFPTITITFFIESLLK